ncbi:hypothetical protein ANN_17611 [Periplaneta americana]|uniref:Uncharacterized protein n=1 Tax=Periplaneta americana TaxID=6978 RepID=A0ABQ8SUV2_PERAM|nr:hypothetical protein ANN_17611 [Periplaneta americana]
MVFGDMRPRIRHRLPGIHLTVGENFVKPNQFLSGHGKFGTYFDRFNIPADIDSTCSCREDLRSVKHLLFDCPIIEDIRFSAIYATDNYHQSRPSIGLPVVLENSVFRFSFASGAPYPSVCFLYHLSTGSPKESFIRNIRFLRQ